MKSDKKIISIAIILLIILIGCGCFYLYPYYLQKQQNKINEIIKTNNSNFTTRTIQEFAQDSTKKPSEIAQKLSDEFNKTTKNPYNKKQNAYTFDTECKACTLVQYDDNLTMVILTTYNPQGDLIARTVIKPPSFVTYFKEPEQKSKK